MTEERGSASWSGRTARHSKLNSYRLRHEPPRVLLVDDDPADQELISRCLTPRDVELRTLDTGPALLEALAADADARWIPDLVLLDLNLPGYTGDRLLPRIREAVPDWVAVIVFTSSNDTRDAIRCYEAGCSTFITKPHDFEHFESALDVILRYWLDVAEI